MVVYVQTWSYGGTMLAMFLTMKASPGWKSRMCDGQTRESEHANTKNCTSDSTSPLNYDTGLDLWDWGKKKGGAERGSNRGSWDRRPTFGLWPLASSPYRAGFFLQFARFHGSIRRQNIIDELKSSVAIFHLHVRASFDTIEQSECTVLASGIFPLFFLDSVSTVRNLLAGN